MKEYICETYNKHSFKGGNIRNIPLTINYMARMHNQPGMPVGQQI